MTDVIDLGIASYQQLLKDYIEKQDENSLYRAEQMSKSLIKKNIPPEEIVNLHNQSFIKLYPNIDKDLQRAMNFLLETMIFYGLAHQEIQSLREEQLALKSEIAVAASMQESLLASTTPIVENLDIGVISVPSAQMNGDYYHFVEGKDGSIGIAIADVIGKGVPAALCMSMIKYAMDSFPEESMSPQMILENLNRVVERNVDPSMFITMFYALYNPSESILQYASAGHEPGFHYRAKTQTFTEINTKGLVLGVLPHSTYKQYDLHIENGDMVILLTDGVTECRQNGHFIESEDVLKVIEQYIHLSAQEQVNEVYKHFERLQNFHLKDDFTLIILRKKCLSR